MILFPLSAILEISFGLPDIMLEKTRLAILVGGYHTRLKLEIICRHNNVVTVGRSRDFSAVEAVTDSMGVWLAIVAQTDLDIQYIININVLSRIHQSYLVTETSS